MQTCRDELIVLLSKPWLCNVEGGLLSDCITCLHVWSASLSLHGHHKAKPSIKPRRATKNLDLLQGSETRASLSNFPPFPTKFTCLHSLKIWLFSRHEHGVLSLSPPHMNDLCSGSLCCLWPRPSHRHPVLRLVAQRQRAWRHKGMHHKRMCCLLCVSSQKDRGDF